MFGFKRRPRDRLGFVLYLWERRQFIQCLCKVEEMGKLRCDSFVRRRGRRRGKKKESEEEAKQELGKIKDTKFCFQFFTDEECTECNKWSQTFIRSKDYKFTYKGGEESDAVVNFCIYKENSNDFEILGTENQNKAYSIGFNESLTLKFTDASTNGNKIRYGGASSKNVSLKNEDPS